MNRNGWIAVAVVVVVLAVGGWFVFSSHPASSPKSSPSPSMSMNMNMSPTPSVSETPQSTSAATISGYAFSPASITVAKGTKVTWTNKDSVGHTVTEDDSQTGPASSTLNQGQSYSYTFNTAGTFHYHCTIHPYMTGTVTVTD